MCWWGGGEDVGAGGGGELNFCMRGAKERAPLKGRRQRTELSDNGCAALQHCCGAACLLGATPSLDRRHSFDTQTIRRCLYPGRQLCKQRQVGYEWSCAIDELRNRYADPGKSLERPREAPERPRRRKRVLDTGEPAPARA